MQHIKQVDAVAPHRAGGALEQLSRVGMRWPAALGAFLMMGAVLFAGVMPVSAATVALNDVHMAAVAGSNRPAVTHISSGANAVYFDYTVITPSSGDTGEIKVFAGTPAGKLVASANLIFSIGASFYAKLAPTQGTWPDGSYCSVLYIDGVPASVNGAMPIGWSAGKVTTPGCRLPALHIKVSGTLHTGKSGKLTVAVQGSQKAAAKALIKLNGTGVGISKAYQAHANSHGQYTFKHLKPKHKGAIVVSASKPGFRNGHRTVQVKS
jgi:hypothetical protein